MSETTPNPDGSKPNKKNNKRPIPDADKPLGRLAETILKSWQASALTLPWITKEEFANKITAYGEALDSGNTSKALNKPDQSYVKTLNAKINNDIRFVKDYLKEAYEEREADYYAEFGIVKEGSTYRLPTDPTERGKALKKLLLALPKHGMDKKKFGTTHWTKINNDYTSLVTNVEEKKKAAVASKNIKNDLKVEIREVLQSIVYLLKASYPKSWENVMQEWGF